MTKDNQPMPEEIYVELNFEEDGFQSGEWTNFKPGHQEIRTVYVLKATPSAPMLSDLTTDPGNVKNASENEHIDAGGFDLQSAIEHFDHLDLAFMQIITARNQGKESGVNILSEFRAFCESNSWQTIRAALSTMAKAKKEEVHEDDIAVDKFASAMKQKLSQKRDQGYSGWSNSETCNPNFLRRKLQEHVYKGDPVDVGNFSMMLFNTGEKTNG